jgi:signal transduction histidine kinase
MLTDELHATFLFESLNDDQLHTLAHLGTEVSFAEGETIFVEGEPGEFLWVLLAGEMELLRHVGGQRIRIAAVSRPGSYGGGVQAFASSATASGYRATARALRRSRFFRLLSSDLGRQLAEWSPMAKHFLDGYLQRLEGIEATVRERERLISLGRLAAGLAHEVNNPAAAAQRTAAELGTVVDRLQATVGQIAASNTTPAQLKALVALRDSIAGTTGSAAGQSALARANAEDEIGTWLEDHDVADAWDLAADFAARGCDPAWLEQATEALSPTGLGPGLGWIGATLAAPDLVNQLEEALTRITGLVGAVKEYSYMDRAPDTAVDVREGIEKTLLVLGHKLRPGIELVQDYDDGLPRIQANGAELNQVWTNLIDNAIDAMNGQGRVGIRTWRDGDNVNVEIADQGPGIPRELLSRVFDPFFTTKEAGKGTGLGLDIVRRIVVEAHHGEVSINSEPGDTRVIVRLPIG